MKDGGSAFPILDNFAVPNDGRLTCVSGGMTLRDYFAGQALAGIMTRGSDLNLNTFESRARLAYRAADVMLTEREKSK